MKFMPLNIQLFGASVSMISAYETDVDIANNRSYIQLSISVTTTGSTWNATGSAYVNATLTGQNNTYSIPQTHFSINKNQTKTVYTGKIGPFYHNDDGSLNPVSISVSTYITSNYSPNGSASCNMSTIARASNISATDADIEGNTNITINTQSGGFTHKLTYSFGNLSGTLANSISGSGAIGLSWTIPTSFYAQIPNAKSGTCTIYCETYSGSTKIGDTKSTTIKINCNESKCKPVIDATIVDVNQATVDLTGDSSKLVRYKSTARITPSASAKNSASISKKTVDGTTVSNYIDIANVSKNSFTFAATDSRNFSNSINKTATMINYVQLTCSARVEREDQTSSVVNLFYSGNYFNGSFGATDNALTMSWKYREKGASDSEWITGGTLSPTISGNTYSGSIQCGTSFDYQKNYEFMIEYADKIEATRQLTVPLSKGQGVLELYEKAIKANGEVLFYWD